MKKPATQLKKRILKRRARNKARRESRTRRIAEMIYKDIRGLHGEWFVESTRIKIQEAVHRGESLHNLLFDIFQGSYEQLSEQFKETPLATELPGEFIEGIWNNEK